MNGNTNIITYMNQFVHNQYLKYIFVFVQTLLNKLYCMFNWQYNFHVCVADMVIFFIFIYLHTKNLPYIAIYRPVKSYPYLHILSLQFCFIVWRYNCAILMIIQHAKFCMRLKIEHACNNHAWNTLRCTVYFISCTYFYFYFGQCW